MTTRIGRLFSFSPASAAIAIVLLGMGAIVPGCIFDDGVWVYEPAPPPPVVVTPPPTVVVTPPPAVQPVIYTGDLTLRYDLGGWSCWELGLTEVEFEVYDTAGWVVAEDWGLPCQGGSSFVLRNLPLGSYWVEIWARDSWGTPAQNFRGWVTHDRAFTTAWLTLY